MSNGPIEPAAGMRSAGREIHQLFVSLTQAGFSEDQALKIIGHMLANTNGGK